MLQDGAGAQPCAPTLKGTKPKEPIRDHSQDYASCLDSGGGHMSPTLPGTLQNGSQSLFPESICTGLGQGERCQSIHSLLINGCSLQTQAASWSRYKPFCKPSVGQRICIRGIGPLSHTSPECCPQVAGGATTRLNTEVLNYT